MAIFAPAESLPSPATLVMPRCRFKRQEHGDSWMVPTTQMFWLQRRWFCQTVGRITPERGFKVILHRHHLLCNNSTGWVSQFNILTICFLTGFSQRVIATILQVSFHYSISRPFDHKSNWFWEWSLLSLVLRQLVRELDVSFSLENQYLATFGRYLGGADFYSSKVIIW